MTLMWLSKPIISLLYNANKCTTKINIKYQGSAHYWVSEKNRLIKLSARGKKWRRVEGMSVVKKVGVGKILLLKAGVTGILTRRFIFSWDLNEGMELAKYISGEGVFQTEWTDKMMSGILKEEQILIKWQEQGEWGTK